MTLDGLESYPFLCLRGNLSVLRHNPVSFLLLVLGSVLKSPFYGGMTEEKSGIVQDTSGRTLSLVSSGWPPKNLVSVTAFLNLTKWRFDVYLCYVILYHVNF